MDQCLAPQVLENKDGAESEVQLLTVSMIAARLKK